MATTLHLIVPITLLFVLFCPKLPITTDMSAASVSAFATPAGSPQEVQESSSPTTLFQSVQESSYLQEVQESSSSTTLFQSVQESSSPTDLFQSILTNLGFHQLTNLGHCGSCSLMQLHREHLVIPVTSADNTKICTKICVDLPRSSYPCPALVSVPPTEKTGMSPMVEPKDSSRSSVLKIFGGLCLDRIRKLADKCAGFQGFLRLCNDGFNRHFLRMCLMLREVILRLRNNGFSVLCLALINELVHLKNMEMFAVNDASIFAGGQAYISSIVPDCLLLDVDLVQLPTVLPITVLPTVECAHMLFDELSHRIRYFSEDDSPFQIWRAAHALFDEMSHRICWFSGDDSPFQIWRATHASVSDLESCPCLGSLSLSWFFIFCRRWNMHSC